MFSIALFTRRRLVYPSPRCLIILLILLKCLEFLVAEITFQNTLIADSLCL